MYACVHTYTHTNIETKKHTYIHTYIRTYVNVRMCICEFPRTRGPDHTDCYISRTERQALETHQKYVHICVYMYTRVHKIHEVDGVYTNIAKADASSMLYKKCGSRGGSSGSSGCSNSMCCRAIM